MIITVVRNELPSWDREDLLLKDSLRGMGGKTEHVLWNNPSYDWGRPGLVLIREAPRQAEHRQAFLCWAAQVAQTTPLWPSVPLLSMHLYEEEQRAGVPRRADGAAARRGLIFLDDLFVYAVEEPVREHADNEVRAVAATRGERAIAFAALYQRLGAQSCLMARVDVRQHPAGEVILEDIHLTLAHLFLAISPPAAHYLAQGCLRLAQQSRPQRGDDVPHAVSYARQASFASRYLLPAGQSTTKGENTYE